MSYKINEYELFNQIMEHTRNASSSKDGFNMGIVYAVGCLVWGWRQEHIKEPTSYYIAQRDIDSMRARLSEHTGMVKLMSAHSGEALSQIKRAESWVEILSERVRMPQGKCRVF